MVLPVLPFGFTPLTLLPFSFQIILGVFNEDLFDLEFDTTQFDNIVLFQNIWLLGVAVADIAYNEINFLESIVRVLELLARLSILLVDILRHKVLFLLLIHVVPAFDLSRLYHIVVTHFANVE